MKIDTQGMSGPVDPNYKGRPLEEQQRELPKAIITPRRLFTPEYVKEMKILINEVLDQRDYERKCRMAYDNPEPPGISYFDTEEFKHRINEPEPEYPKPSNYSYRLDELQE